ncbi:MAG: hypothetical protein GYB68_09515 [Chloroflexi bacterium]|nr:hypothetical protein [Chloroflexota bacterium]
MSNEGKPPIPALRKDQRAIMRHKARFKVVACGRRWGKTTLGLWLARHHASMGERVWWVAPSYPLAFHPWRDLKAALHQEWTYKLESERFIELDGGGSITIKSADDPDSLRGVGIDFLVMDEAAYIHETAWGFVLRPALADRKGRALIISTPNGRNWFYQAYRQGQDPLIPHWRSWRAPTADNPLIAPEEIADAQAFMPAYAFKQEYLAEFQLDVGKVFRGVREAAVAPLHSEPRPDGRYVMGVDWGRELDFTALVVIDVERRVMVALDRFTEISWRVQRERIAALARKWAVREILAEANAMGQPNIEALQEAGLPITGFTTTGVSKRNLIDGLAIAIENGELRLLSDAVLIAELEDYGYSTTSRGHVQYSASAGRHDDTVVALALAWRKANERGIRFGIAAA